MANKKEVICSGLNGFVGSSLKEYFQDEINFYDFNKDYEKITQKTKKYDAFINLATSIYPSTDAVTSNIILKDIKDNINFYDFYKNNHIDKFIFVSSAGAMGTLSFKNSLYLKSFYANNKFFLENIFRLSQKSEGLYILRCTNIYGSKQIHKKNHGLIPQIIKCIKNNDLINIWGDGEIHKNFIYIDDFSKLIRKILDCKGNKQGTYNVGYTKSYTINDLLMLFQEALGTNLNIKYLKQKTTDNSMPNIDISYVRESFNWTPEISLEEGIKRIYDKEGIKSIYDK